MKKWHKILITILVIVPVLLAVFWPPAMSICIVKASMVMNLGGGLESKVELIDQRTESSKKYSLGGDSYAIEATIGAIHYKNDRNDKDELWKDIDTTISPEGMVSAAPYDLQVYLTGQPGFHYVSKELGEFDVRLNKARQSDTNPSTVSPDNKVVPIIEGNTVTWYNLYPDVDVVLTAFNTGVMLNRIIKSPSAPLEYDVQITEVEKGVAQLMPLKSATDANGQLLRMEEKPINGGRTETLKLEVIEQEGFEAKPIAYPIRDSTEVFEEVGELTDDCQKTVHYGAGTYFTTNNYGLSCGDANSSYYDYVSGLRFQTVAVPNGATIDSSYLTLVAKILYTAIPATIIEGELVDDAATFSTEANFDGRDRTDASVNWTPSAWVAETTYNSADISTIVKEIVDQVGWASGQNMAFFWRDASGYIGSQKIIFANSYRDSTAWPYPEPPKLYIEYTEGGGEPSLTNSPSSKAFGTVADSASYWSNGSEPSWPLSDGDAYFTISNDGSIAIDIYISSTDFDGGGGWTLVTASPSAGEARILAFKEGDGNTDNITIINDQQLFIESLASSDNIDWEIRLDVPTVADQYQHSANITLEASAS